MIPVDVDNSTIAATSFVMGIVTTGFCFVNDIKILPAMAIGLVFGLFLYLVGVIPIGLLLGVGIGMCVWILKKLFQ